MVLHFFGLTPEYKEVYLEYIFILMYHLGFTYKDAYNTPIGIRKWFIDRLAKEFKKANEQKTPPHSKASHMNTPDMRLFKGKNRLNSPSRLNRAT